MKTLGKISLTFFCAFVALLIAGIIVLASTGSLQMLEDVARYYNNSYGMDALLNEGQMDYQDQQSISLDGIRKIKVETSACMLTVQQQAGISQAKMEFQSGALLGDGYAEPRIWTEDGVLHITTEYNRSHKWIDFDAISSFSKCNLILPDTYRGEISYELDVCKTQIQDIALEENLEIEINGGTLELSRISAKKISMEYNGTQVQLHEIQAREELEVSLNAGDVNGQNITARKIDLESEAAKVSLTDVQGEVESDSKAGEVKLAFSQITGNIETKNTAGSVELSFPKGAPIWANIHPQVQVEDHMQWTDGQYRMKDAVYSVEAKGNATHLILKEQG